MNSATRMEDWSARKTDIVLFGIGLSVIAAKRGKRAFLEPEVGPLV